MLTHLEPKDPKKRKQQKTLQNAVYFDGRRQGRQPLSPSERRDAVRQGYGQLRAPRALAGFKRLRATAGPNVAF